MAPSDTIWPLEAHTAAKHEILRRYLGAWLPIMAAGNVEILYLDGFCGPGKYTGGEDGSPVIALQTAISHSARLHNNHVHFYFLDADAARIEHLNSQLGDMDIPDNFHVQTATGEFEPEIRQILDECDRDGMILVPTFAFVDPFGFSGLPFDLVCRLLNNPKTEIFINIMAYSVNRFLEHPQAEVRNRIEELFGTPQALEIARTSQNRMEDLRELYKTQLKTCARFVQYFEMANERGGTIYYLFFAGNNSLGHKRMKEAFWKIDPSGGYRFSAAMNTGQMVLFESEDVSHTLAEELIRVFAGRRIRIEPVENYVDDETVFLGKHMRSGLKWLEENGRIMVEARKSDGSTRRRGTFPKDTIVNFP